MGGQGGLGGGNGIYYLNSNGLGTGGVGTNNLYPSNAGNGGVLYYVPSQIGGGRGYNIGGGGGLGTGVGTIGGGLGGTLNPSLLGNAGGVGYGLGNSLGLNPNVVGTSAYSPGFSIVRSNDPRAVGTSGVLNNRDYNNDRERTRGYIRPVNSSRGGSRKRYNRRERAE